MRTSKPRLIAAQPCETCYGADPDCALCHGTGEIMTGGAIVRDTTIYSDDGVKVGDERNEKPVAANQAISDAWKEIAEIKKRRAW